MKINSKKLCLTFSTNIVCYNDMFYALVLIRHVEFTENYLNLRKFIVSIAFFDKKKIYMVKNAFKLSEIIFHSYNYSLLTAALNFESNGNNGNGLGAESNNGNYKLGTAAVSKRMLAWISIKGMIWHIYCSC
ncbi:hypothetical protein BpHYR1_025283 [Brachionus plicatilis]|uniref:Uncharacterized protein n=1 Tax=Brachionus plicatilis TaxID=10195 RepID=A0A3M7R4I8_BRAPC|nr:hypothetical protein BpHYR1_025283 [Brachionus plicatilis]